MTADYCRNCDGRKCMDCCSRTMHDQCVDDCPDCCATNPGGQPCENCIDRGEPCPDHVKCKICWDMGVIEFPELLPCSGCDPARYLADLVLCGLPTDTDEARAAAGLIIGEPDPPLIPLTTDTLSEIAHALGLRAVEGDPW